MKSIITKNVNETNIDRFYQLIIDNFTIDEVANKEEIVQNAIKNDDNYKISFLSEDDRIIAFALYFICNDAVYLEYLVSDINHRKLGYAYRIVQSLMKNYKNIIIAVDNNTNEIYYKKIGAQELDFVFECPPLGNGKKVINYKLLCINYIDLSYKKLKTILNAVFFCYDNANTLINRQFNCYNDDDLVKIV